MIRSLRGARRRNVIGSYLHGSLLPKNPAVADFLIGTAVKQKYDAEIGALQHESVADLTARARSAAAVRPR